MYTLLGGTTQIKHKKKIEARKYKRRSHHKIYQKLFILDYSLLPRHALDDFHDFFVVRMHFQCVRYICFNVSA